MSAEVSSASPVARRRNHAVWIGVLLTLFGFVSYFTLFARSPAVRDVPWVNLPLVTLGFGVSVLGIRRAFTGSRTLRAKGFAVGGGLFSFMLAGALSLYVFQFSYGLPTATDRASVGSAAPDFTLTDHTGTPVRLHDLRGSKVLLIEFASW